MAGGRFRLVDATGKKDLRQSFEQGYRESYPMVYNYVFRRMANREATEDVVAESFLRAARFYDRFDPSRAKFSTWVISISRRCMLDWYEREPALTSLDEIVEPTSEHDSYFDDRIGDTELAEQLLSLLDSDERELVYLKYYEGKRNLEIARELDMNASTVSTKLSRALAKMRAGASSVRE